jgi:sec-independent protein translocase protein TatA
MGGWESPSHWLVIAILVVVLFGYKKLPDAAKSVGRSLRAFRTELKGEDEAPGEGAKPAAEPAEPPAEPTGPTGRAAPTATADPAAERDQARAAQRAQNQAAKQPE